MSEQSNPYAETIEGIERLEVELKTLIRKRDQTTDPREKEIIQREVEQMEADLRRLQAKLD